MNLAVDPEGAARISTLWTPLNGRVCYPAVEAAQPLGNSLARHVVSLWDESCPAGGLHVYGEREDYTSRIHIACMECGAMPAAEREDWR